MKIKNMLFYIVALISLTTFSIVLYNAYELHLNKITKTGAIQDQYLDDTFRFNKSKLIGDVIINDNDNISDFIEEIHNDRGVSIQLKTRNDSLFIKGTMSDEDHYKKYKLENEGVDYGEVVLSITNNSLGTRDGKRIFFTLVMEVVLLFFIFFFLSRYLRRMIITPLESLISSIRKNKDCTIVEDQTIYEISQLTKNYSKMRKEIKENASMQAFSRISQQVAHDIRSPLAALDMMMKDVRELPEDTRVIMRSSVSRIHDIANQLLSDYKQLESTEGKKNAKLEVVLLSGHIDSILSEKRTQFRSKSNVTILSSLGENAYGLFSKVDTVEFKRIISNLINNSVEEFKDSGGEVLITLKEDNSSNIILTIKDNGNGIPSHILKELGKRGRTFGKSGGSGLGLFHARTTVETWGGKFNITSELGSGTSIVITLKKAGCPESFVPELNLRNGHKVVVMDDDDSIHQVWKKRIADSSIDGNRAQLIHFTDSQKFRLWKNNGNNADLYLVDFELIGQNSTGIMLINEFNIQDKSILVTSRFEENNIINDCRELKLKILPKGLAAYIPICIKKNEVYIEDVETNSLKPKSILLDDDELVRFIWKSTAKKNDIDLDIFSARNDLFDNLSNFSKDSHFYIDSDLEGSEKGEDIIEELYALGYENLHMATGYESDKFNHISCLKSVLGKTPPWVQ